MSAKQILLVEDDSSVARILQMTIERQGHSVEWAANGRDALEVLERLWPDVLITDINMPHLSGRDLCLHIREHYPERSLKVVVMTSMTEREERAWVKDFDDIVFMEKPLSPRQLLALIEEEKR